MKKRAMTLIETVISLSLVSILLTTLLFWYGRLNREKYDDQKNYKPLLCKYYAYHRLEDLFSRVTLDGKKGKTTFYKERDGSVVFTFDNGIHPNPALSDVVLGKLFFENDGLYLTIWPQPREGHYPSTPRETYLLLNGADSVSFTFLAPEHLSFLKVQPKQIGEQLPSAGIHEQWAIEYNTLPAQVHVELTGEIADTWVFDLNLPLFYPVVTS